MLEANFPALNGEHSNRQQFTLRLAAYCNNYVMDIAKPIMQRAGELFEDKAIVCLVDKWFEADTSYNHKRRSYLAQWAEYDESDKLSLKPQDFHTWERERAKAYRFALDALLIGQW